MTTWKLFLAFLSDRENLPAHKLETRHVNAAAVIAFLDYLETHRGNSVAKRNLRLAAIKATMAFQATTAPEQLDTIARIHTIPVKKHPKPEVIFLTYGKPRLCWTRSPPTPGPADETGPCSPWQSKPG